MSKDIDPKQKGQHAKNTVNDIKKAGKLYS